MSDTYIRDRNGHLTRAEDVTAPQNNAWEINGRVIEVDMHKDFRTARELYRAKVKAAETVQARQAAAYVPRCGTHRRSCC